MMNQKLKLLIVSWAGFLLVSCGKQDAPYTPHSRTELPTIEAIVAQALLEESPVQFDVSGIVRAKDQASIAPKIMGTISAFSMKLGQHVEKGELLVKIDAAEIGAKVSQAETQLKQAQRDLEREQGLLAKDASTAEMVRNLADRVSITEAMLNEAQAMLAYTEIRAPFAGSISRIYTDEGSLTSPGVPLLELEGNSGFEIEAAVPESLAAGQTIGLRLRAGLPSSHSEFEVTVTEVSSASDADSRTVNVRFSVPSEVVARPGQFARITLSGTILSKILVPQEAVSKRGQMERVFVVEDDHAVLRLVKTGAMSGELLEVISGLDADEWVVVHSSQALLDGQPLKVDR